MPGEKKEARPRRDPLQAHFPNPHPDEQGCSSWLASRVAESSDGGPPGSKLGCGLPRCAVAYPNIQYEPETIIPEGRTLNPKP